MFEDGSESERDMGYGIVSISALATLYCILQYGATAVKHAELFPPDAVMTPVKFVGLAIVLAGLVGSVLLIGMELIVAFGRRVRIVHDRYRDMGWFDGK